MNILKKIAKKTKARVKAEKKRVSLSQMMGMAQVNVNDTFLFETRLRKSDDIAFICELKKASPSKGIIAEDFPYLHIAWDYIKGGATALSVLTEPFWFMGCNSYLQNISKTFNIPILRKDFTIDPYMIYETKALGAHAVLLICSLMGKKTLTEYIKIAHSIGLSALVETHDEAEVEMALSAGARIIGVNNRNLKTFDVDINLSARLRKLVPDDVIFISESGIQTAEDVQALREIGANAVLIGESIMRQDDKKAAIENLRGDSCQK